MTTSVCALNTEIVHKLLIRSHIHTYNTFYFYLFIVSLVQRLFEYSYRNSTMGGAPCFGESPLDTEFTTEIKRTVDRTVGSLPSSYTVSYST